MTKDQDRENKSVTDLTNALLKINGALLRSGTSKDDVVLMLPREDWLWLYTVLQYETTYGHKFFKFDAEIPNEFKLSGITIRSFKK